MNKINKIILGCTIALGCSLLSSAHAGVISVAQGSFNVSATESFETFKPNLYSSLGVLGGSANMTGTGSAATGQYFIANQGSWGLNSTNQGWTNVLPSQGNRFATIYGSGYVDVTFGPGVSSFGGYFADVFVSSDTTFSFYDQQNNLLATSTKDFQSLAGEMIWAGFTSDTLLGRVRISGDETAIDGLVIGSNKVPEPGTIALLGLGLAALSWRRRNNA